MRQILFFVSLEQPFGFLPEGTETHPLLHIGLGWLLLAGLLGYLLWNHLQPVLKAGGKRKQRNEILSDLLPLFVVAVVAFVTSPWRVIPAFGYGGLLLVGFLSATVWAGTRSERVGIPRETIWDVAMLILVTGIIGARLFFLFQYPQSVFGKATSPGEFLFAIVNLSEGGLVLYGGVIFGSLAYFAFCYLRKLHPLELADVVVPSIFLGLGFGRLGCLMNGCCYGDRCELPWAIVFPQGSGPYEMLMQYGFLPPDATVSLPLHPTQIYSSLGGFLLAFVTALVFRYRRKTGEVLAVGAILYPINRFLIEFVRGDEFTQFDTGLTISQLVSLGVLAVGVSYLIWLEFRGNTLPVSGRTA